MVFLYFFGWIMDITEYFWKMPVAGCVAVMSIPEYFAALTKY